MKIFKTIITVVTLLVVSLTAEAQETGLLVICIDAN
jgi:hypothetical protein